MTVDCISDCTQVTDDCISDCTQMTDDCTYDYTQKQGAYNCDCRKLYLTVIVILPIARS